MQSEVSSNVRESMSDIGRWLSAHDSRILTVLVLLTVGLLLAFLLRALAVRALNALGRAIPGFAHRTSLGGLSRERRLADIVGSVVFWIVLLVFVAAAADELGLALLSGAAATLRQFVPRVLAGVLILVVGLVLGNVARGAVTAANAGGGSATPALGQMVRLGIVGAAALLAVAKLGVDITFLTAILSVALAALLGGFALAFGLGARTAISNIIGSHYVRQTFEVGQTVRIGDTEGTIAALTPTAVVLHVAEGSVIVPAKQFVEMPSMLIMKGEVK